MIDRRAEPGLWLGRLETILMEWGVLNEDGEVVCDAGSRFQETSKRRWMVSSRIRSNSSISSRFAATPARGDRCLPQF